MLTGCILVDLSPYWFDAGMTGRWAYVADSVRGCAAALHRLGLVLDAAGAAALRTVALLPDPFQPDPRPCGCRGARPSGGRLRPWQPRRWPTTWPRSTRMWLRASRARPGQVVFDRATCWTDPPRVAADVSGLLGQVIVPPWAGHLGRLEDGTVG